MTWLSPGAERAEEHPWLIPAGGDGSLHYRPPSYHYSNSFVGDPGVWSDTPPSFEASPRRIRSHDVRFPSAKVVMWDAERFYLAPQPQPTDPRPVLFADGSAHLKQDADATPPVANPYWPRTHVYNDTPNGVHGRDF